MTVRIGNLRVYQSVPWQIFRSPARRSLDPQNHQTLAPDTLLDQSRIGEFGSEQLKAIDLIRSCEKFADRDTPIVPFFHDTHVALRKVKTVHADTHPRA
jgi:hypothetical protein